MSSRGGGRRSRGRGGGRGGCGRGGRGHSYSGATSVAKKGLCSGLGGHVFDYGQKGSADQMRTSYEKLVQYVGTSMGTDILNELRNKVTAVVPEPVEDPVVTARHALRETVVRDG